MQQEGFWQNNTSNDTLGGRSRRSSVRRNSQHGQQLSTEIRKTGAGDGNRILARQPIDFPGLSPGRVIQNDTFRDTPRDT